MMQEFAADEIIFSEGDPGNAFYIIAFGEVGV
jgi:CRP-like cAMP-binding protein